MDRRRFLGSLLATGLLAPLGRVQAAVADDEWQAGFAAARRTDRGLIAYESAPLEGYAPTALHIDGKWPAGLRGTLYRNGPARHAVFGARYHHLFDGDGMVHRYAVGPDRVSHRARYVQTQKLQAENAAGRALESAFGTARRPPANQDAMNVANTSIVLQGDRLLALWEGGSAYALDPVDLSTRGPVRWSEETAGLPFSAHPQRDADGSLWNIGMLGYQGAAVIYHLSAAGALLSAKLVPLPMHSLVHAFMVTARHLIIPLPPLVHEAERAQAGLSFLDCHVWRPELGTQVLILDKDDLEQARVVSLPAGFIYHYGNGWESADGAIRFDAAWYDDPSLTTDTLVGVMRGEHRPGTLAKAAVIEIAPEATEGRLAKGGVSIEFPTIDPRLASRRNRFVYSVGDLRGAAMGPETYSAVLRHDLESGTVQSFDYGQGVIAEEHLFVARPGGGEADGWLIGTSLDIVRGRSRIAVLDAAHLADGPLAVASLPYAMPTGFHGSFAPAA